jgi:hypothetical protein
MGWTASYQLLRQTPISPEEIAALAQLNQDAHAEPWEGEAFSIAVAQTARPDGVIAAGWTKFPNGESEDPERLQLVLERMVELVAGAELRVIDDYGWFEQPGKKAPEWISVAYDELIDPAKLAPPALPQLPEVAERIAAELAGEAPVVTSHREIEALYRALGVLEGVSHEVAGAREQTAAAEKLLDRGSPDAVALVGLELYPQIFTHYAARAVLERAFDRVTNVASLTGAFLSAWTKGEGVYYHGNMPLPDRFCDALAAYPEVWNQMREDLKRCEQYPDDELLQRRGTRAVELLVRSRDNTALAAVLELIMRWRDKPRSFRFDYGVWSAAHEQLARRGDERAFAALVLYLDTMKSFTRSHAAALTGLVRIDARRAAGHVKAMAAAEVMLPVVVDLLPQLGDEGAIAQLRRLAAFPSKNVSRQAREGLARLGVDAGARVEPPPPEDLLLHRDGEVRESALREVYARKEPALYLSLAAAAAVDAHLRARTDSPALPFTWYDWDERLPEHVLRMRAEQTLQWAVAHAEEVFGAQTILAKIAPVLTHGSRVVADAIPSPSWKLADGERALLRHDEQQAVFPLIRHQIF